MQAIPSAKQSPRVEELGSLYWYYLDTFQIDLEIKLFGDDGSQVDLEEGDIVIIEFLDKNNKIVHTFTIEEFQGNIATLDFNDNITAKFLRGTYKYNIVHIRDYHRTIAHYNKAVVE